MQTCQARQRAACTRFPGHSRRYVCSVLRSKAQASSCNSGVMFTTSTSWLRNSRSPTSTALARKRGPQTQQGIVKFLRRDDNHPLLLLNQHTAHPAQYTLGHGNAVGRYNRIPTTLLGKLATDIQLSLNFGGNVELVDLARPSHFYLWTLSGSRLPARCLDGPGGEQRAGGEAGD